MKDLKDLLANNYNNKRDQWEKTLKTELKIEEIAAKTTKNSLGLGKWPTLSLESGAEAPLAAVNEWKKASQTYVKFAPHFEDSISEDLSAGVRLFFFHTHELSETVQNKIKNIFTKFVDSKDLEVILLGECDSIDLGVKTFKCNEFISADEIEIFGGDNIQELALITLRIIESKKVAPIAVRVDSHFFKNIAKIRAAKLLALKVYEELGMNEKPSIIALNSYREWTLFERYSNMLRNNAQVASALIAGADFVQSSGYEILFDLETDYKDPQHDERSLRMARNTSHILSLESMLGIVQDASYGSFHIENLSFEYAEKAWSLMQELIVLKPEERMIKLQGLCQAVAQARSLNVETRKVVLAGMNDFPDGKERIDFKFLTPKFFRVSREFEELRMKVAKMPNLPSVVIVLEGDYASLNGRVNFIKNYFELIGLKVIDPLEGKEATGNDIVVFCAKDEDYPALIQKHKKSYTEKYLAGKVEVDGCQMIFAGQNIYKVLLDLVTKLQGGK